MLVKNGGGTIIRYDDIWTNYSNYGFGLFWTGMYSIYKRYLLKKMLQFMHFKEQKWLL